MNAYHVGQQVRVWAQFVNEDERVTDPTVITLKYRDPAGSVTELTYEADLTITLLGTGEYYADFIDTAPGTWRYRWETSGTITAAAEGQFHVLRSAFA